MVIIRNLTIAHMYPSYQKKVYWDVFMETDGPGSTRPLQILSNDP